VYYATGSGKKRETEGGDFQISEGKKNVLHGGAIFQGGNKIFLCTLGGEEWFACCKKKKFLLRQSKDKGKTI